MKQTTTRLYCLCGGSLSFTGTGPIVVKLIQAWQTEHDGPGHAPVTAAQCGRIRRKIDVTEREVEA